MDSTEELYQAFANAVTENVENVISDKSNKELQFDQTVSVRVPKIREQVSIDKISVQKIKKVCEDANKEKFPYAEVFLGMSTLFLGAFLSALLSKIPYAFNFIGVLSYSVCPFAGIGFGVAYIFKRKNNANDIKVFSEKILEYIEDSLEIEGED